MASILVTGGAGYVGRPVLTLGNREFVHWGPLVESDIRNAAALDALFKAYRIDAVMHLAALAILFRHNG
jgi:UDP-glucose 4-epimerase